MKDKIDTIKKWFKPYCTKTNIFVLIASLIFVALVVLMGVLVW